MSIYEYDEEKHMRQVKEEGIEQGRQEGIALGKQEGLRQGLQQVLDAGGERLCRLSEVLLSADRKDDLLKAIVDEYYRRQLYEEFRIE